MLPSALPSEWKLKADAIADFKRPDDCNILFRRTCKE